MSAIEKSISPYDTGAATFTAHYEIKSPNDLWGQLYDWLSTATEHSNVDAGSGRDAAWRADLAEVVAAEPAAIV